MSIAAATVLGLIFGQRRGRQSVTTDTVDHPSRLRHRRCLAQDAGVRVGALEEIAIDAQHPAASVKRTCGYDAPLAVSYRSIVPERLDRQTEHEAPATTSAKRDDSHSADEYGALRDNLQYILMGAVKRYLLCGPTHVTALSQTIGQSVCGIGFRRLVDAAHRDAA